MDAKSRELGCSQESGLKSFKSSWPRGQHSKGLQILSLGPAVLSHSLHSLGNSGKRVIHLVGSHKDTLSHQNLDPGAHEEGLPIGLKADPS